MKLMIVTNNDAYKKSLERVFKIVAGVEDIVARSHNAALETFLLENPTHILVCEYEEGMGSGSKFSMGRETWKDLKASARPDQRLVRCGFMKCDAPDFVRQPVMITDLFKALGLEKRQGGE